jgi:GT2 family glycosyltransferase
VAPGRNAAAKLAVETMAPTHMAFLDNDMEFEPDFLSELYKPFTRDDRIAQTQAKLRFFHDRERLNDGGGCSVNFWLGRTLPVGYGEIDRGQYDTPKPCVAGGGAMIVRADVFQELGGFDTTFSYLGPDDLDFSMRIAKAGYKVLYVPTAVAYHEVSHTYGRDYDESYARLKARNWLIFMRRHATIPQQVGFLLFGLPYGAASVVIRQARRGNLRAVRGLASGAVDYLRSLFSRRA